MASSARHILHVSNINKSCKNHLIIIILYNMVVTLLLVCEGYTLPLPAYVTPPPSLHVCGRVAL